SGTWTGVITYGGNRDPRFAPCPSSEPVTLFVSAAGVRVDAAISCGGYGQARFSGRGVTNSLSGQFQLARGTCAGDYGCFNPAIGNDEGSFEAKHIHLEPPNLTTDCAFFGGNPIDVSW